MPKQEFKFIDRYRTLMPAATPEMITARQKGHAKLYPEMAKTMERVYDMCALAFNLPRQSDALTDWFEKPIRDLDPQFMVTMDKAEASRIASLLLEDLIWRGSPQGALAVIVASFGGRRTAGDDGKLIEAAHQAVDENGRTRRIGTTDKKIAATPVWPLKAELEAMTASFAPPTVTAVVNAVITKFGESQNTFATAANEIVTAVRTDNLRLAEELDMLWWHVGGWSELLERRMQDLEPSAIAMAAGRELGSFVKVPSGPHGAYGLLRRALSGKSTEKAAVVASLTSLGQELPKLNRTIPASLYALFPITGATNLAASNGVESLSTQEALIPGLNGSEITYFELATQTFRETVLIGYGGLGK